MMKKNSIYLRRDGRWEGRIFTGCQNGKYKYKSFFGKTSEEVRQKMTDFRNRSDVLPAESVMFSQAVSEWFASVEHRVKESTAANYRLKIDKHILPAFGERMMETITPEDIYEFIRKKQESHLSNRYISDILILLKSVFRYACAVHHVVSPMDNIHMPKSQKPDIRLLDKQEQKKLQQYIADNQNLTTLGIILTMFTGLRIGELCALQWKNIDIKKRILTVRKTIQRVQCGAGKQQKTKLIITSPKSESSCREIPIPDSVIAFLRKFQCSAECFLLSGTEKPVEPRTMQYRFSAILKNVKLPSVHFHSLRHMFASNCVKLGFDTKALSEILGHSKVEVTLNRYVHSSIEQKSLYMNRLKMAV